MKSGIESNVGDAAIRITKKVACRSDTYLIQIFNGSKTEILFETAHKVTAAHMSDLCQLFYGNRFGMMLLYISENGPKCFGQPGFCGNGVFGAESRCGCQQIK